MTDRPKGATILGMVLASYGGITLLAVPIGLVRAIGTPPLLGILLVVLVGVAGITAGVGVWRLAYWAPSSLPVLAASVVAFNAWAFWPLTELSNNVILGLSCGFATGLCPAADAVRRFWNLPESLTLRDLRATAGD